MSEFAQYFRQAKEAGLGLTMHIAEVGAPPTYVLPREMLLLIDCAQVKECPSAETLQLLSFKPDRLGHATFLDDEAKKIVHTDEMCIELCLSSNLLCKTVPTLDVHHIRYYLGHNHPIAICVRVVQPNMPITVDLIIPFYRLMISSHFATRYWANTHFSWRRRHWASDLRKRRLRKLPKWAWTLVSGKRKRTRTTSTADCISGTMRKDPGHSNDDLDSL